MESKLNKKKNQKNSGKKKKVQENLQTQLSKIDDKRFDGISQNPLFRRVPKREKQVKIDDRFQSMFNDEKFKVKYKVDKRGRPVSTSTDENLQKYYNLEKEKKDDEEEEEEVEIKEESESESENEDEEETKEEEKVSKSGEPGENEEEEDNKDNILETEKGVKLNQEERKKLCQMKIDYARGEGQFMSESSEDSSSSEEEIDAEDEIDWGEFDKDAERTEESTSRLAVCNMDWDRVHAVDLFIIFHSFVPTGGLLKSVSIYPSEFGKEKMAEEDVSGPKELFSIKEEFDEKNKKNKKKSMLKPNEDEEEEGEAYRMEKLRKYQINRLKYYYAVAAFDSRESAEKVYTECDGMEYETSSTRIDLRYIPEDMEFNEEERKEICDSLPPAERYRPRYFTTTALQQMKVDLTWDETDPLRRELTERLFNPKENVDAEDLKAYLASSSEEEEEENEEEGKNGISISSEDEEEGGGGSVSKDPIAKYKALLGEIENSEKKKKEKDVQMEISWDTGIRKKSENLVKKKLKEDSASKMTPWEEQLDKRKEKRKSRKQDKKNIAKGITGTGEKEDDDDDEEKEEEEGEDEPFSDDEVDVDLQDGYFKEEMNSNPVFKDSKKKKDKKFKNKMAEEVNEEKTKDEATLELLLMDEEDNKKHFSLKKILESENPNKNKKKNKKKLKKKKGLGNDDEKLMINDDFKIDVKDNRFSALYKSHHYNIDPSDPNYKKTLGMEAIIKEKLDQRINPDKKEIPPTSEQPEEEKPSKDSEISYLLKSIKRNTINYQAIKNSKGFKKQKLQ